MRAAAYACVVCSLLGCSSDATFLIVTVESRPAVRDATQLVVSLSNDGSTRMDSLLLSSSAFPVTFSISAPDRTGDLDVQIDAIDVAGLIVGRGATTTAVDALAATVFLDSADFVVNTDYADDQFLSDDFEANGFQLAAASDGVWTAAFRERCTTSCEMRGRRFDATGAPVATQLAAGTNAFKFTTSPTTTLSTPAIATAGNVTLAVWDFEAAGVTGISCRGIDQMGAETSPQQNFSTDPATDVVSIAPLSNNNFAVTWNSFMTTSVVRLAIVKPDCAVLGPVTTASSLAPNARRASVAASGSPSNIMVAWIVDGDARISISSILNVTQVVDAPFLLKTSTDRVEYVRVAPIPSGFAVAVRWAAIATTGRGKIEVYRTNMAGVVDPGMPVLVTDAAGADFASKQSFGIATNSNGVALVVWHACGDNGDGNGCGVFGRLLLADGSPGGEPFSLATTTTNDQTNPSAVALPEGFAVAWKDSSTAEPDRSGTAVRARIVYP